MEPDAAHLEPIKPHRDAPSEKKLYPASQKGATQESAWNQEPTKVPPPIAALTGTLGQRHVICVIGLPFSGQIPVTLLLKQYLEFMHGADVRLFDVNDHASGTVEENRDHMLAAINEFLVGTRRNSSSSQLANLRPLVGRVLSDSDDRFANVDPGKVAIVYDTDVAAHDNEMWSGSTKRRRRWIVDQVKACSKSADTTFIEVIINDPDMLRSHLRLYDPTRAKHTNHTRARLSGRAWDEQLAALLAARKESNQHYTTIQSHDASESDLSYVQVTNFDTTLAHRMRGFLRQRVLQVLAVANPRPRTVYLSRHGFSEYNVLGKLGGNPPLSQWGEEYAKRLGAWAAANLQRDEVSGKPVRALLWTSSMQRTILTASRIPLHGGAPGGGGGCGCEAGGEAAEGDEEPEHIPPTCPRIYRAIDEIFVGDAEGLTEAEFKARYPSESDMRKRDKIGYRYPRGESYYDIIGRLDPLMIELLSLEDEPLLVVSHQATLRMVRGFLMGKAREDCPGYEIPLHTVMKITWDGWSEPLEEEVPLGPNKEQVTREVAEMKEAAAAAGKTVEEVLREQRPTRELLVPVPEQAAYPVEAIS